MTDSTHKNPSFLVHCLASLAAVAVLSGCAGRKGALPKPEEEPAPAAASITQAESPLVSPARKEREDRMMALCHKGGTVLIEWRNAADELVRKDGQQPLYEGAMACLKRGKAYFPYFIIFDTPKTQEEIAAPQRESAPVRLAVGRSLSEARTRMKWLKTYLPQAPASQP